MFRIIENNISLCPKQQSFLNPPNPIPQHSRFFKLQIPSRRLYSLFKFDDFFSCIFFVVNFAEFNLIFAFQTTFSTTLFMAQTVDNIFYLLFNLLQHNIVFFVKLKLFFTATFDASDDGFMEQA